MIQYYKRLIKGLEVDNSELESSVKNVEMELAQAVKGKIDMGSGKENLRMNETIWVMIKLRVID